MATQKQIDANRHNAQSSTGPQTPEGKQIASLNALQSGIYAESTVIPGEDPADLQALTAEYFGHHRPATPEARALVDSLVHNDWLLRRFRHTEAAFYNCDCSQCETRYAEASEAATISMRMALELKKFDVLQRRINSTERNYHRSLKALRDLTPLPAPDPEPVEALGPQLVPPPDPPQPTETEPTSEKLASFPQNSKKPSGEAAAPAPDPATSQARSSLPNPDPFFTTSLSL